MEHKLYVNYCNGVAGVPITYLDNHNPKQFEILGYASGRNEFDRLSHPIKRYINAVQHNKDGTTQCGNKINTRAVIRNDTVSGTYYTADNANGKLEATYVRVFVRKKIGE